jgi:hypothetical protein
MYTNDLISPKKMLSLFIVALNELGPPLWSSG